MHKVFNGLILSMAVVAAGGCKKTDATDQLASDVKKTKDDVVVVAKEAGKDVDDTRVKYTAAVKERLAKMDAKLEELGKRTDEKAKDAATTLRARRDQLAVKLEATGDKASSGWDEFKKDVDGAVDSLEKDFDEAMK